MNLADWVGIPYEGEKFCRVFATRLLAERGIPLPGVDAPGAADAWARVPQPSAFDVVLFNLAGRPAHVGVCIGGGRFLHVEEGQRSRIERLASPMWGSRIEGFYRYTGART